MKERSQEEGEEQAGNQAGPFTSQPPAIPPPDWDVIQEFMVEAAEHIVSIENGLLILERDSDNAEVLHSVFRAFHSVKGLAGFLNLPALHELSHEIESVLDLARKGKLDMDSNVIDLVLAGADYVKRSVDRLGSMAQGSAAPQEDPAEALVVRIRECLAGPGNSEGPRQPAGDSTDEAVAGEIQTTSFTTARTAADGSASSETAIRIPTSKLDYLVDMVGEMVIAESLIRHDPEFAGHGNSRLLRNLTQLNRITGEIQKTAMAMRMIPVRHLFRRMARLVRDLARKAGKQIELTTAGEDTELDRTIIEELVDPLMHMIRNAVDHGIESSEQRSSTGKPAVARINLKAYHQAAHIIIEVSDDGRGMDRQRILAKAREIGLVGEESALPDAEVLQLIFQPGFSTASQVTDVSGRGVGMDVVRRHIDKLRGRIHIESKLGIGTTFLLKMPLTLAIIDGLVVGVGPERYVVPIFAVREVLRPTQEMISTVQNRGEMALVRDSVLPIVRLHRLFEVKPKSDRASDGILIVSDHAGKRFCLLVDQLLGKQEVVIKGMGAMLKNIAGIAGSAILGDGHVGLILDMDGLCYDAAF